MNNKRAFAGAMAALAVAAGLASYSPRIVLAEPSGAFSADSISYVDERGAEATTRSFAVVDELTTTLGKGWYVVDRDVVISGSLTIGGDARLVLQNGTTLTVQDGITVAKDAKLTLYAQDSSASITPGMLVVQGGIHRTSLTPEEAAAEAAQATDAAAIKERNTLLRAAVCAKVEAGNAAGDASAVPDWTNDFGWYGRDFIRVSPLAAHNHEANSNDTNDACETCGTRLGTFSIISQVAADPADVASFDVLTLSQDNSVDDFTVTQPEQVDTSAFSVSEATPVATPVTSSLPSNAIVAQSSDSTITVTFDPNGGSGTMDSIETTAGASFTLPECTFTPPEGKTFDTWSMGNPGDSVSVPISTTIRAFWKTGSSTQGGQATGGQTSGNNGSSTYNPGTSTPSNGTSSTTSTPGATATTTTTTPGTTSTTTTTTPASNTPSTADVQNSAPALAGMVVAGSLLLAARRRRA